jgi:dihydroorotase
MLVQLAAARLPPTTRPIRSRRRCRNSSAGAFGIIGLETAIALALEELVVAGKITLARLVELFTTGPESVMWLGGGTLAPRAAGDVTVFSTGVEWTYDVNQSASRSRNSPFHGRTFHGRAMATAVDGEMKWRR